ncbi:MAG: SRPBCC domain-containing protein, partial [Actinomycetota bacterium]
LVKGLFDGEHRFTLEPTNGGGTRVVQGERFSGALVPLLRRSLDDGTLAGFRAMNEALKRRVEA